MISFFRTPPSLILPFFLLSSLFPPSLPHSTLRWSSPQDPCYHLDGRPKQCLSEFINAAYSVPVSVNDSMGGAEREISSLTDLHNPHNLTCWQGEEGDSDWILTVPLGRRFEVTYISLHFCQQVELSNSLSISILKSMDHGRSWKPLQFYSPNCPAKFGLPSRSSAPSRHQETEPLCSDPRPLQRHRGGQVLAFSTLDGRPSSSDYDNSPVLQDWVTATDIRIVFHRHQERHGKEEPSTNGGGALRWRAGSKENGRGMINRVNGAHTETQRFGEETGRVPKTSTSHSWRLEPFDKSWRMTNKGAGQAKDRHNVTKKEHQTQRSAVVPSRKGTAKGKGRGRKREGHQRRTCGQGGCDWTFGDRGRGSKGQELRKRRNNGRSRSPASSLSSPHGPAHRHLISLSDLQVGGRCKCNGHASQCRRDGQGRAVCQCEHHTAGPDCDVCHPFFSDRPWQRATPSQSHPCVPCECNGHSSKCRFSMEVFQQSGRRSGGVCLKCRHQTAGRHCQYCQDGFTRDHSKPLTHRKACRPCQCHPVGAVGRWCNQTTGQCLCRDGVTGVRCNRCALGYQQGRSPIRPCLKIQLVVPTTPVYQPQYSTGEECDTYCQPSQVKVRMNLETFCLKDYVLKLQVRGMERSGPWWQFSVWVQTVFRVGASRVRRGLQAVWVPDRDLGCGCPALQVGRAFLLIGAEKGQGWGPEEKRLVADRTTLALLWREHWSPKLRGFRGQDRRGRCPAKLSGKSTKSAAPLPHSETGQLPHAPGADALQTPRPELGGVSPPWSPPGDPPVPGSAHTPFSSRRAQPQSTQEHSQNALTTYTTPAQR